MCVCMHVVFSNNTHGGGGKWNSALFDGGHQGKENAGSKVENLVTWLQFLVR